MHSQILRDIGFSENEIKIYLVLLKGGPSSAYELAKKTGIYRVHIYDKVEQLMSKGLVTHVFMGAKKHFQAAPPQKIQQYLEEKKKNIESQEKLVLPLVNELSLLLNVAKQNTYVEVFKGTEGIKFFLRDIVKVGKEVLITGIDDSRYEEELSVFMKQYFRDLRKDKIHERVITHNAKNIFLFTKREAPTTQYRFLDQDLFNPTNTFVYGDRVVIVSWDVPVTAVMIRNKNIAQTYRNHFEHLWKIAREQPGKHI